MVIPAKLTPYNHSDQVWTIVGIGANAFDGCTELTSVTIEEGIGYIGNNAFNKCKALTSVTLPSTLKSIGNYAFSQCTALESARLPEGLEIIGASAFSFCSRLTSVVIPTTLKSAGANAWYACTHLESVELRAVDCSQIGSSMDGAFSGCSALRTFTIADGVRRIPGCMFNGCYIASLELPSSVEAIGNYAFCGVRGLAEIDLSNITSVGASAFASATAITSITIPAGMTSIGSYAFSGISSLREINYNAVDCSTADTSIFGGCNASALNIGEGVVNIASSTFKGLTTVEEVSLPSTLKTIGDNAFNGLTSLAAVELPQGLTTIGVEAFSHCSALSELTIPESVESIGTRAFQYCSSIRRVNFNAVHCADFSYGAPQFEYCTIEEVVFGDSVERVPAEFLNQHSYDLQRVHLGASVREVGAYAFTSCFKLTEANFPEGLESIYQWAFYGCALTDADFPQSLTYIGENSFTGNKFYTLRLPPRLTSVPASAFWSCNNLQSLHIPASVTSLGKKAFGACPNLKKVFFYSTTPPQGQTTAFTTNTERIAYVPAKSDYLLGGVFTEIVALPNLSSMSFSVDGAFYVVDSAADRTCILIDNDYSPLPNGTLSLPASVSYRGIPFNVTSLGACVYSGHPYLRSLTVGLDCDIPTYAFSRCPVLTTVIADNAGAIDSYAFSDCPELADISVTPRVTDIAQLAFCQSATDVTDATVSLDNSGAIGYGAFAGCTGLHTLTIGSHVTSIGSDCFSGAFATPGGTATLNNSGNVGSQAFYQAPGLASVYMGPTVGDILSQCFSQAGTAADEMAVELHNAGAIATEAFANSSVTSAYIDTPNGVGAKAFAQCDRLESVTLSPRSIGGIGDYAFSQCPRLEAIELPLGTTTIGSSAFTQCSSLASLTLPPTIETIGTYAFTSTAIESLTIPASVITIGEGAFHNCKRLAEVTFAPGNGSLAIGRGTSNRGMFAASPIARLRIGRNLRYDPTAVNGYSPFASISAMRDVDIDDTVTDVPPYLLYNCTFTEQLSVGDAVTTIGEYAFKGCTAVESLSLPATLTAVGDYALADMSALTELTSAAEVPPVCGIDTFNGIDKFGCTLRVAKTSIDDYRAANGWKEFFFVESMDHGTGIPDAVDADEVDIPAEYYDLQGRRIDNAANGLYIVRRGQKATKEIVK